MNSGDVVVGLVGGCKERGADLAGTSLADVSMPSSWFSF